MAQRNNEDDLERTSLDTAVVHSFQTGRRVLM